jgi:transcriptional regulator with GAF, ATPase, and Fis domain
VLSDTNTELLDGSLIPDLSLDERNYEEGYCDSNHGEIASRVTSGPLKEIERHHILSVLQRTGWVIEGNKGAAELLAIHPNTLRSRMKRLGIERPKVRRAFSPHSEDGNSSDALGTGGDE